MVDRGADKRQAEGDVDAVAEAGEFQYRQALVVVHGEYGVGVFEQKGLEQGVGGIGAAHIDALLAQVGERGFDNLDFFAAEVTAFAGMRVEAGHQNTRGGDAEFVL